MIMADSDTTLDSATPVGRLAPSPTGTLHLGNARSFLLAWLQIRALGGKIILRIEDLDGPRAVEGADKEIVRDLDWLGLDWDNELTPDYYQSNRYESYRAAIDDLRSRDLIYPCYCSRKALRAAMSAPHGATGRYPGNCRDLTPKEREERAAIKDPALRLRVEPGTTITFTDILHGEQQHDLYHDTGDFIVARSDGIPAYHLAVVLDDIAMGITHILRGDDLLDATPAQFHLINLFNAPHPTYAHVPLLLNSKGERLAKRFGALPISHYRDNGMTPNELLGHLAASLKIIPTYQPTPLHTLIPLLQLPSLPKPPTHLSLF